MAKRDRNSTIWKDTFYRSLPPLYKCLWDYIKDDCDNAGVWIPDFKVASICIGKKVKEEIALNLFSGKIQVLKNGHWLLPSFISEVLGFADLNDKDRFQRSIIDLLNKHYLILNKGLVSTLQGTKDIDIERIKDKDKEEKGVQGEKHFQHIGEKNGVSVSVKARYLHETPKIIHDLQEHFRLQGQLDEITRAGWIDFVGFMAANPGRVFETDGEVYHSFKKFSTKPKTELNPIVKKTDRQRKRDEFIEFSKQK